MGFRFHRSIGNQFIRLNLSKTGFSLTSGVPGVHINVPLTGRKRRMMSTLSLPGTGLSYRKSMGPAYGGNRVIDGTARQLITAIIAIVVASYFISLLFGG